MYLYIKLAVTSSDLTLISLIPVGLSGIICREYHRISMDFNFLFTSDIYIYMERIITLHKSLSFMSFTLSEG